MLTPMLNQEHTQMLHGMAELKLKLLRMQRLLGAHFSDEVRRAGNCPGDDIRVAVEELRGAVNDNEAQARRLEQHWRRKCVVHDVSKVVLLGEGRHCLHVSHADQGIADGLHIENLWGAPAEMNTCTAGILQVVSLPSSVSQVVYVYACHARIRACFCV